MVITRHDTVKSKWILYPDDKQDKSTIKHPSDVTSIPGTSRLVVADSSNHWLSVMSSSTGKVYGHIADEDVWPNCVDISRNGHAIVSDRKEKTVKFYDVATGVCVNKWEKKHVKDPYGVAVNSKGHVIITDTGMDAVCVFSTEGHLIHRFGTKGEGLREFNLPFYCTTNSKDQILVSDNMNYCIKIYDDQGNHIEKIGSRQDWGKRKFQCPYGIVTDHDDNILVVDNEEGRVYMHNSKGAFVKYILNKPDNCQFPCGITISDNGMLVVTQASFDYGNIRGYKLFENTEFHDKTDDNDDVLQHGDNQTINKSPKCATDETNQHNVNKYYQDTYNNGNVPRHYYETSFDTNVRQPGRSDIPHYHSSSGHSPRSPSPVWIRKGDLQRPIKVTDV